MHDVLMGGRHCRILNVVNPFYHAVLTIEIDLNIVTTHGYLMNMWINKGLELLSMTLVQWFE